MKTPPPHLSAVMARSVSTAERENVATAFKELLQNAGIAPMFDNLKEAGFTIIYTEPEKPGLKVTISKQTSSKKKPLFLSLSLTESPERGLNQPVIDCQRDDQLGVRRLSSILDIPAEIEKWVFRNLPRIIMTSGRNRPKPFPALF